MSSWQIIVPRNPSCVQPLTAACLGLHSTASSWARPALSPEAPSTLAATLATAWWDRAWPFAPGTPRATTCGVKPSPSAKVRSRQNAGVGWGPHSGSNPTHSLFLSQGQSSPSMASLWIISEHFKPQGWHVHSGIYSGWWESGYMSSEMPNDRARKF